MRAVGLDEPLFVRRGEGAYLEDVEGERYLDWVMSWGPLIFGHADPETVDGGRARRRATGRPSARRPRREVELAGRDRRRRAVGRAGAARLLGHRGGDERDPPRARVHRPRPHPQVRRLLPRPRRRAAGGARAPGSRRSGSRPAPASRRGVTADTLVAPYNDVVRRGRRGRALRRGPRLRSSSSPSPGTWASCRPSRLPRGAARALRRLRRAARLRRGDHRLPRRAAAARRSASASVPDLTILGKIVGGGLPLAAFGGRADIMERLAPAGDVYQAGTLSGNPLATAAGLSVLRRLRDASVYERARAAGARLEDGTRSPFGRVQRVGAMLTLFLRDEPVRNYDERTRGRHRALRRALPPPARARDLRRPSQFEALFVSLAHTTRTSTAPSRPLATSATADLWDAIGAGAARESPLWEAALRPRRRSRSAEPVFSDARAGGVRARPRDDLRGLPRSTTADAAAVRAGATGTPRCCSATTCTRTGSSASPSGTSSTRSRTWPS